VGDLVAEFVLGVVGDLILAALIFLVATLVRTIVWLALLPLRALRWLIGNWPTSGSKLPKSRVRRRR
jgi:hypothetical protein